MPGSLVAIIVTTTIVNFFHIPVETIGSQFGEVPNTLPMPRIPELSIPLIKTNVSTRSYNSFTRRNRVSFISCGC